MDRKQIGVYAGKVWQLLSNNEKWGYGTLKNWVPLWAGYRKRIR